MRRISVCCALRAVTSTWATATVSSSALRTSRAAQHDAHPRNVGDTNNNSSDNSSDNSSSSGVDDAVDAHEAAELAKDRAALRRGLAVTGFAALCVVTMWCGMRRARRRYFGDDGSARVHVESRGRPSLGGPFVLVNTAGEPVSQAAFRGAWTFFYFGFTHCPEICPVELNRMSHVVREVHARRPQDKFVPLFVSCDPRRDSLAAIAEYLSVFHEDFIGLVGTPRQVNETCKSYRIYYSLPSDEEADAEDYLIDHSIAIFLFDPQGRFVDFFGNRYNEEEMTERVLGYMQKYAADPTWTNW